MVKRGRRIGQTVNPRDERGWMIPRAGTIRRQVYDLMVKGKGMADIHKALPHISYASCTMHKRHIVNSDRANALAYNVQHPDEPIAVPGGAAIKGRSDRDETKQNGECTMIARTVRELTDLLAKMDPNATVMGIEPPFNGVRLVTQDDGKILICRPTPPDNKSSPRGA